MILWTIKLISSLRKAVAGRRYPHQMAWAVAFGLLLGIVPHGNLLAIGVLLVVLSLKINHALAGLTAVAATFVATRLDPFSHEVGNYVLTQPRFSEIAISAWQLPIVPWTDLNNTVVMGSFLIGCGALIPVFVVTYPVFRMFASESDADSDTARDAGESAKSTHQLIMVDQGHNQVASPHHDGQTSRRESIKYLSQDSVDFVEVDDDTGSDDPENRIAVETRIDVIRMKDYRGAAPESASNEVDAAEEQQPMDEALNYLLRQLRDSQQRKAA